ncbi:MAG: Fur family transcriptional regulator [Flavobacteriaceae bacterium]|jgi:Fur family ferric uptake transcriptional regulator|nr:Fur family transcriptional regulator [Flavobacteriaceae bacterium]
MLTKRRNTPASTAVLNLIQESKIALSHAEIQERLAGLCDRVTIYRVLERLTEDGLIHKIINSDASLKYASCSNCDHSKSTEPAHNHVHFSCLKCKSVVCLENVQPEIILPEKYQLIEVNFTVSGICPNCQ